eukprot:2148835-Rhodomonas_salina.3
MSGTDVASAATRAIRSGDCDASTERAGTDPMLLCPRYPCPALSSADVGYVPRGGRTALCNRRSIVSGGRVSHRPTRALCNARYCPSVWRYLATRVLCDARYCDIA